MIKSGFFLFFAIFLSACVTNCDTASIPRSDLKIFFTPGQDCENNIIDKINKSKKIDIAVYSITNQNITRALINAYKQGTEIRIITDKTQAKGQKSLVTDIKKVGIPVLINKKHKIEHNKFAIFDESYVVSGSYNWTTNATMYNSENCLFFSQPNKEYTERFEYLWNLYKDE